MELAAFLTNPVLTGIFGGSLAVSALYVLRSVPKVAWDLLSWRFSTEVTVFSEDASFDMVSEWLSSLEYARQARKLRLTAEHSDHEQRAILQASPGIGTHLIWFKGRPVLVTRSLPKESGGIGSQRRREDILIRTIGPSPSLAHDIIRMVADARSGASASHVEVFLYKDWWRLVARKAKRKLTSVVMPESQRQAIVDDIERFRSSRAWYTERGIPYRRGFLFAGVPGTGKTSLVFALASHFSMRVYALNLGSIRGDNELIDAITSVPENAVLLIEDIDAAQQDRDAVASDEKSQAVTMSGLLNAIDGVFSRDGRVLVMTTNHPEKLDAALVRPGRADRIERIGDLQHTEVRAMCKQFLGQVPGEGFALTVKAPIRPAELQRLLLEQRHDAHPALKAVG